MLKRRSAAKSRLVQTGLSLVELMVGVAVGLLVVAGASTVVATQLADSRRLVVEAQVQQDLRSSADIITRELRRAGSWSSASGAIWAPGVNVTSNPNGCPSASPADFVSLPSSSEVCIAWSGASALGFRRLAGPPGVLQLKDSSGAWQTLTDAATLNISNFNIQLVTLASSQLACPTNCAGGGQACWPTVQVRELQLSITGNAVSDPNVVRQIQTSVRLRNDRICNNRATPCDPAPTLPLCPA
jgi:type IV pilus assembly protein PilW